MHPLLLQLLASAGITVDANATVKDLAALTAIFDTEEAKTAIAALTAKLAEHGTQATAIAALKAQTASAVDLSQYVPVGTYTAVVGELAALKANHETVTVDQVIKQAQDDGKFIAAAEHDYLKDLGNKQGIAALKATLDARPTIAALKSKQTTEVKNPADQDKTGVAALTADQKLIADQLGISHKDYAKQLAADKA